MSGRVRVTLSDGRRVTGYRKTLRRQGARLPPHEMPDWRLWFLLPTELAFAMSPGRYDRIIGLTIGPHGAVAIVGKNKDWLFQQAATLLRDVGKGKIVDPFLARLTRDPEQGPTLSGPLRRGEEGVVEITVASGDPVVTFRDPMRTMIL